MPKVCFPMRNDPLDPLTVIGSFCFIEMLFFLAFFTYVAFNEPFVGEIGRPEFCSIGLVGVKMIQISFVVWADLDRNDASVHGKNYTAHVIFSIIEVLLVCFFFITYFIAVKNGTLDNQ